MIKLWFTRDTEPSICGYALWRSKPNLSKYGHWRTEMSPLEVLTRRQCRRMGLPSLACGECVRVKAAFKMEAKQ